jgi:uroporphyrinogen decarboxylase
MSKRTVVQTVLAGGKPPYVPWSFGFTQEAHAKLAAHYGGADALAAALHNHLHFCGDACGYFSDLGNGHVRDIFGVVWDRTVDHDIGIVANCVLPEPTLRGFTLPDPALPLFTSGLAPSIAAHADCYRVYPIGFSLHERAWTLRGMANLMMDFIDHPAFAHELFETIADFNIELVRRAVAYDIDAVYFGDDWGQQHGLQMGPAIWREFIYPALRRQYAAVRAAGKQLIIHSCGDVDELFDDLVGIGLNCFNPFQPEVMPVYELLPRYRGRLAFFGGLSTQRTLPYGTVEEVRQETRRLLELGRDGGYILAPAHAVEGDVPLENMLAFIDEVQRQPGWRA